MKKIRIDLSVSDNVIKQVEKEDSVSFEEVLQWLLLESEEGLKTRKIKGKITCEVSRIGTGYGCGSRYMCRDGK